MQKPFHSSVNKVKSHLNEIEEDIQNQFKAAQETVSCESAELSERVKAARFIWLVSRKSEDKRRMLELFMQLESK